MLRSTFWLRTLAVDAGAVSFTSAHLFLRGLYLGFIGCGGCEMISPPFDHVANRMV